MAKWKNLYCYFPTALTDEFLKGGIKPRRFSGGDVLTVYPSRAQVEKAMKGMKRMSLVLIDSKKLDSDKIVKVDYNNVFYRGTIPSEAFKLVTPKAPFEFNPNGKNSLANIHSPSISKIRGLTNGGKSKIPSILKKRRRL